MGGKWNSENEKKTELKKMEMYVDRQVHPLDMQYEIQITFFIKKKCISSFYRISLRESILKCENIEKITTINDDGDDDDEQKELLKATTL